MSASIRVIGQIYEVTDYGHDNDNSSSSPQDPGRHAAAEQGLQGPQEGCEPEGMPRPCSCLKRRKVLK